MEIWKPLRNFPNYNCSSEGRIMNIRTQRILSQTTDDKGYARVTLRKNNEQYNVRVHRLVADTFLGECFKLDVRHKDLDRSNNRVDNLEYCTRSDTVSRAYDRGTKSVSGGTRVLVIETGDIFDSINKCARAMGCDRSTISKCLAGRISNVKGYHVEVV